MAGTEEPQNRASEEHYEVKVEIDVSEDGNAVVVTLKPVAVAPKIGRPVGSKNKSSFEGKPKEPTPKSRVNEVCSAVNVLCSR